MSIEGRDDPAADTPDAGESIGPWQRRGRRLAYVNDWITVYHDEVDRPDGSPGIYGVVHFANRAVGVVAIDEQDRVVLVGQHRYPLDRMSWEIPEGGSPLDEEPLEGARRELREETGLSASTWSELGRYHLSNSISDEEAILFQAAGLVAGTSAPEASEELSLRWVPFEEALAMVESGEITDAMSVIGLERAASRRRRHPSTGVGGPD